MFYEYTVLFSPLQGSTSESVNFCRSIRLVGGPIYKSVEPNWFIRRTFHVPNVVIRFGTWKVRRLKRALLIFHNLISVPILRYLPPFFINPLTVANYSNAHAVTPTNNLGLNGRIQGNFWTSPTWLDRWLASHDWARQANKIYTFQLHAIYMPLSFSFEFYWCAAELLKDCSNGLLYYILRNDIFIKLQWWICKFEDLYFARWSTSDFLTQTTIVSQNTEFSIFGDSFLTFFSLVIAQRNLTVAILEIISTGSVNYSKPFETSNFNLT